MKKPAPVHIPSWTLMHSRRRFCLGVKIPGSGGAGRNPNHSSQAGWPGQLSVPSPPATCVTFRVTTGKSAKVWYMGDPTPLSDWRHGVVQPFPGRRFLPCSHARLKALLRAAIHSGLLRERAEKGPSEAWEDCLVIAARLPLRTDFPCEALGLQGFRAEADGSTGICQRNKK